MDADREPSAPVADPALEPIATLTKELKQLRGILGRFEGHASALVKAALELLKIEQDREARTKELDERFRQATGHGVKAGAGSEAPR